MKYIDSATTHPAATADFSKSTGTQLSSYISSESALLHTIPPLVPAATFTILHNGSFGSGFKCKALLPGITDNPSLFSLSFYELHSVQLGLPFCEILLALCVLRIWEIE